MGRQQRLRLAGRIGMSTMISSSRGVESGVEVWDEPTQYLSEEGIEELKELLRVRAERYGLKIFLVDHRAYAMSGFCWKMDCCERSGRIKACMGIRPVIYQEGEYGYDQLEALDLSSLSNLHADSLCRVVCRGLREAMTDPTRDWLLSTRARNVLLKADLRSVLDLRTMPLRKILVLQNCGPKIVGEVYAEGCRQGVELPFWQEASFMTVKNKG